MIVNSVEHIKSLTRFGKEHLMLYRVSRRISITGNKQHLPATWYISNNDRQERLGTGLSEDVLCFWQKLFFTFLLIQISCVKHSLLFLSVHE